MASSNIARVVCAALLVLCMVVPSLATVYTVGDTSGWVMGVDYSTWTSGKTFTVGDSLVFNYGGGHTVDEVSAGDYKTCTVGNSLSSDSSGASTIALKTAGTRYFICAVVGHCGSGMKLAVTVSKTKKASAPAPSADNTLAADAPTASSGTGKPSGGNTTVTTPAANKPTSTSSSTTSTHSSSGTALSPIAVALLVISWPVFSMLVLS
ncbi:blue copper protein-like [Juglans microcarpa x Juglans regia]|uniref:blue copper protein-like n=1 Tax=Juglans microcarpa x Juglans regia TaxID=2249226 RepID=UPI001B7EC49A|nr:blue copper protein-like [Juglans microcarpa x Juglans regia]